MPHEKQLPKHLYLLDIIRGLAALIVVLWHWQHLLYVNGIASTYRMEEQPFYKVLSIFYHSGWMAVDFFFSLSGFVFFWLYAKSIADRKINSFSFFVVRFSRLYPLHFATFAFVLLAQLLLHAYTGTYFVYQSNDLYRAVLNLFLASSWGVMPGNSFNGPIWSVSVEVLLYVLFFVMCFFFRRRYIMAAVCALGGIVIIEFIPEVGRGILSFFVGGLTFRIFSKIVTSRNAKYLTILAVFFSLALWAIMLIEYKYSYLMYNLESLLTTALPTKYQTHIPGLVMRLSTLFVTAVTFPSLILALALTETLNPGLGKRFSSVGNLSYSSYLLHFPLQLTFFALAKISGVSQDFFYSEYSLLLFYAILIPLCLMSYNYFELPMQRLLRANLSIGRVTTSDTSGS